LIKITKPIILPAASFHQERRGFSLYKPNHDFFFSFLTFVRAWKKLQQQCCFLTPHELRFEHTHKAVDLWHNRRQQ